MTHRFLSATLIAGALLLSACGGQGDSDADNAAAAPEPDNVVARVNGKPISAVELDAQVQAQSSRGQRVERSSALDQLIDLKVLATAAEDQGLPEQPEIAAQIERQRAALLAQHLVRAELSDFQVSEDDLRQAYKEHVSGMDGKEYKASHILLDDEDKAKEVIAKLDDGGDFAELAKKYSTGPTSSRGGDLGWFQPDQMVEAFADAVRKLEPGKYTEKPVKTRFGWHVVKLEDVRDMQKPKFEDIKSKLRNQLVSQHVQDYIASLREKADVEITDDTLDTSGSGSEATPEAAEQATEG